jgi:hypothetical protein
MHGAARKTSHGFITLLLRAIPIIGDSALHAQAGLGAAVKERRHGLITENGRDRNRAVPTGSVKAARPLVTGYFSLGDVEFIRLRGLVRVDPGQ